MAGILKFVYAIVLFLSIFIVVINIDGKPHFLTLSRFS